MSLNCAILNLVNELKNSNEYKDMQSIANKITKNSELNKKLSDFNNKNKILYTANLSKREIDSKITEITEDYNNLLKIRELKEYFKAGEKFNILMNSVIKELNEKLLKQ